MKISAYEFYTQHGYSVEIHITPYAPGAGYQRAYLDLEDVMNADISDSDVVYKKGTPEYMASVLRLHLPAVYERLRRVKADMVLTYNIEYF